MLHLWWKRTLCKRLSQEKRILQQEEKKTHAHTAEDNEPTNKRFKREKDDSDEEYVLISTLTGTISHGSNDWLVDSGASKHMTGYTKSFVNMSEHEWPHKVKLGDDYQYAIKESGEDSYNLDYRKHLKMKGVLYVLGLKKNILSISAINVKGMRVAFVWPSSNVS